METLKELNERIREELRVIRKYGLITYDAAEEIARLRMELAQANQARENLKHCLMELQLPPDYVALTGRLEARENTSAAWHALARKLSAKLKQSK